MRFVISLQNYNQFVNGEWKELGFDEANYEALAFDKATGWSRLLKRNNATYNR